MADEEQINQDEIEALLQQAQGGKPKQPPAAPSPEDQPSEPAPASSEYALDQNEIEALIQQAPTVEQIATGQPAGADMGAADGSQASDVELLLSRAEAAIASIDESPDELPPGVAPFQLDDFSGTPPNREAATIELVRDVQLDLRIELGRTRMHLEDVLRLRQGAVVPLDKLAGDPVDLYVNGRLVARGEVLVLNDNFCVRVTELVTGESAVA